MDNTFYAIPFWDIGTPSFVSGCLKYFGTEKNISDFADVCRKSGSNKEFMEGYDKFISGEKNVMINIAYAEQPLAEPVILLGSSSHSDIGAKWELINVWGFPYYFKSDEIKRELIWIKHGKQYIRAARYTVLNFLFNGKGIYDEYRPLNIRWGNNDIILPEENSIVNWYSLLYLPERYFTSEEECLADLNSPQSDYTKDFASFCFEFIADG